MLAGQIETFLSPPFQCGGRRFVVRASKVELAGAPHVVMAHQGVSELFAVQRELRQATEQLLSAREDERARIGLELHDSVSQHLVAVGLGLAALRRRGAGGEVLEDMAASLTAARREIRSLAYLLHTPEVSRDGLVGALRAFVDGLERRTGLAIELRLAGRIERLPFDVQRAIFRVVQEALANVHCHAHATTARVTFALTRQGLRLAINDDGRTPLNEGVAMKGVGISGMAARMRQFGGSLEVRQRADGTSVRGFIPRMALGDDR